MLYFVSRQHYWGVEDPLVVEIAVGGLDYANPDMLSDPNNIYGPLGDMLETNDPREALEAAVRIRDKWQQLLDIEQSVSMPRRHQPREVVRIEAGFTHGCTIPFEEHPTDDELRQWAEEEWEATPKCAYWHCDEPLPERERDQYMLMFPFDSEDRYCSECCADEAWQELTADLMEESE